MRYYFLIVFSLLAFAAKAQDQSRFSDSKLLEHINFITQWTSYGYDGESLPKVVIESHALIQLRAYGDFVVAQAEFKGEVLPNAMAVYDTDLKTMFLSLRIEELGGNIDATLVHELVHYMQDINGFTESLGEHLICSESEAYDVQMLWQIINGVKNPDVESVKEQALQAATACMGSQF